MEFLTGSRSQEPLREEIRRLGRVIGAGENDLVHFRPIDGGYPYVWEDDDGRFHWRVVERGQTLERRTTDDRDELLYWVFASTTFTMAGRWASRFPVPAEEYRVTLFRRQFELLHTLEPRWARRRRTELIERLRDLDCLPKAGVPELPGEPPTGPSAE